MSGSQQSEELIEHWARNQHALWSAWLGQPRPETADDTADASDATAGNPDWLRTAADLWGQDGVLGRLVGNLLGSQEMLIRSTGLLARAWQSVLPDLEADVDWQASLKTWLDRWIEQAAGIPEQSAGAAIEAAKLLDSILLDWSPVLGPGLNSACKNGLNGEFGAGLLQSSAVLERILGMEQAFEPAVAGLGEIPRAGLLRERNAKLLLAVDAAQALREAAANYQLLIARGLAAAVEATIRHVIEQAEAGTPVAGVRGLVRAWFRIADKTLLQTFSTPEFIAAQNALAARSMDYKVRQREVLALVHEALEIPTREELDDVYLCLHQLKREVRELRRAQRPPRPAPPGATGSAGGKRKTTPGKRSRVAKPAAD